MIPNPPRDLSQNRESFVRQSTFGFRYIWNHRPLFNLQMMFFSSNLLANLCITVLPALVLARTGNSPAALAAVQSASAIGGLVGGAALTALSSHHCLVQSFWGWAGLCRSGLSAGS